MSSRLPAITVEQLLALNDEIGALSRAGVPLESGLRALGGDLPGRLGRLAEGLSRRLEKGESLVEILESSSESFPPVYRAVVAAGLRTGRLPSALESIAISVRNTSELRQTLMVAMAYPLFLAAVATIVFTFSVRKTIPVLYEIFELLGIARPKAFEWMVLIANRAADALPWVWVVVLIALGAWWFRSRRAALLGTQSTGWLPTLANVRFSGRMATFADVLATLVEHQVPLDEGIPLAAAAGGGRELEAAGKMMVDTLRRGGMTTAPPRGMPPLLTWLIVTSPNQPHLARALRHSAAGYRRRALRMSIFLGTYVPIFLSAFIGGVITLYFVILTMAPFYYLLYELGLP